MAISSLQLRNSFQKPYDRLLFSKDVLSPVFNNGFSLSASLIKANITPTQSESHVISDVYIYGQISLEDGTQITCYEINLQPNVKIEYSKVAIQHYIRKLLIAGQAALINFVSPSNKNLWRLTLVAKDSILTDEGIKERTTYSKRFTYLLGTSESCKTAAERFEFLSTLPSIDFQSLINAFSVEKLSKAFFDEYTRHYENFVGYLTKSSYKKVVFSGDEKAIRDFTKKLLGRIVFLYFVQKKGWLGASDTEYKDGNKNFIMDLFTQSGAGENFYPQWLTKLFFDTLNNSSRKDDVFEMPDGSKVKIPFLNGGLFDKEEYDEKLLTFKSKLFHNHNNDEDPKERGFLDFLNAFNFTIYEDSPDEKTVAVDPEMLGHIFENLLEDNKDKGAFYTPKEIVHYMCQESLIEYLSTHLSKEYTVYRPIGSDQVEIFGNETRTGQLKIVEEIGDKALNRDDVSNMVKSKDIENLMVEQIKLIDNLLDKVKICDPAIGSGAFPMGLLLEIYSIKELIAYKLRKEWKPSEVKENIIQYSIYGIDIEKGAVDIARLRFWLSLVVDEDKPKPLPNLDYKIVVGDSLISKFDGEIVEIEWNRTKVGPSGEKYVGNIQSLLKEVTAKQREYFDSSNKDKKKLSAEIRRIKIDLLINQVSLNKLIYNYYNSEVSGLGLELSAKEKAKNAEIQISIAVYDNLLYKLNKLKSDANSVFNHFDWKLDFPEILNPYLVNGKGGFDIVIANPPYIKEYTNRHAFDGFRHSPYYQGKMDIWYGFACVMLDYLKDGGVQCFIAQNNWITSAGASIFRNKVLSDCEIKLFTDFGNYKVFETAGIQTMIYILQKTIPQTEYVVKYSILKNENVGKVELNKFLEFENKYLNSEKFYFNLKPLSLKGKTFTFNSDTNSCLLDKIKAKHNFILRDKPDKKQNLKSELGQGIVAPQDFVNKASLKKLKGSVLAGDGIFVLSQSELDSKKFLANEKEIIKPYYTTDQLQKYYGSAENTHWIIYTKSDINKANKKTKKVPLDNYPKIKQHLDTFKNVITSDFGPYGLHRAREQYFFECEKIMVTRKCPKEPIFTYTDFDCFVSQTFFVIQSDRINLKYLTGLLNSKLVAFWLRKKGKMQGNVYQLDKEPLLEIPIYKPADKDANEIAKLVDKIISLKQQGKDSSEQEKKIDELVYKLYDITADEQKIIEGQ